MKKKLWCYVMVLVAVAGLFMSCEYPWPWVEEWSAPKEGPQPPVITPPVIPPPVITFTSIADFATWLDDQQPNTAATAYTVKLNISGSLGSGSSNPLASALNASTNSNKYVYLDFSGSTFTIVPSSLFYNGGLGTKTLVGITIPNGVTNIQDGAFSGCTNITSITIPNTVTTIGLQVFSRTALTSVTIPASVTSIGSGAFSRCTSLTTINVDMDNTAFSSQDGILYNKNKTALVAYPAGRATPSFVIPGSVTAINSSAFNYCTALTSVTIPVSVTKIWDTAFAYCTLLTSVTFATGSNIPSADFGTSAFPEGSTGAGGNTLKTAYYAAVTANGDGAGTYERAQNGSTWTKQ